MAGVGVDNAGPVPELVGLPRSEPSVSAASSIQQSICINSGDILIKNVEGPSLTAATEHGDLIVYGDSNPEAGHFLTKSGNVRVSNMFNQNHIIVQNRGNVDFNLIDGSISCMVQEGTVHGTVENLKDSSIISVRRFTSLPWFVYPTARVGFFKHFFWLAVSKQLPDSWPISIK